MLCSFRHGWAPLAVVFLLALSTSTYAIIAVALPLSAIVNDSEYIVVAKVEKIDAEAPLIVLNVQEDLKGKAPFRRMAITFKGDEDAKKFNHVPQLLTRLAPDLPVIVTILAPREKLYQTFVYTNGTWFHILGQETNDAGKVAWSLTHGEPNLRGTYKGTTAELRQLIIDNLAGKAKLPKENKKEPPGFGPEIPAKEKEKSSRRPNAVPWPLSPISAGGGPLFGVIPTLGVGAPLVVLAALFPAVFGGVLVLFRQWIAFITVFSVNSMLVLLYALFNWQWPGLMRGSWLGSDAGLWFLMTLAALGGTVWAWHRQLLRQSPGELELDAPRKTELTVLWILSAAFLLTCVLTPVISAYFIKYYDLHSDIAFAMMIVLTVGVLAGTIYRVAREFSGAQAPLATEGVMIVAILLGQVGYTAYRWGGEDVGATEAPSANVAVATSAGGLNAPQFEKILWQFTPKNFSGTILAAPLLHGDEVFVAAARTSYRQGSLFCLRRADGTQKWEFFGKDGDMKQMISSPVFADGRIYIGEGFHDDPRCRMFCLNLKDHSQRWAFQTGSQTEGSPCVAGGKVYFGAGNDGIYCVDADSAEPSWRYPPKDYRGRLLRFGSTVALAGNRLYAGSAVDRNQKEDRGETAIFCFDAENGKPHWKKSVPLPAWAGPVLSDGQAFFALGNGDVLDDADNEKPAGLMLSANMLSGEENWRFDVPNGVLDKPAVDAERIYFGCRDGHVYCLGRRDGKLRWKTQLDSPVVASPVVAACPGYNQTAHVFAVTTAGKVACLNPITGEAHWTLPLTDRDAHFSATPRVVVARSSGGDRRQLFVAGSIGGVVGRPVVYCLEDFVKVE
jgi:outer membrane protein assembly factor BamB